jgi:hypothetical protein
MLKQVLPALVLAVFSLTPALADETDIGARLYQESCSGCHGASGKGGGELSQLLSIKTPALTGLAAANDGAFPMLEVIHIIDGRTGVRAHGGPIPTTVQWSRSGAGSCRWQCILSPSRNDPGQPSAIGPYPH